MQDSAAASFHGMKPQQQLPEQEQHLKCPRCDSTNTKFCYYNNYNLSQPRHFCKNCKRYWTKGGALRNIPVGGSTRKNSKRSSSTTAGGGTSATNANATSTSNNGNPPKRPNSSTISNIPASPSPISSAATSAFGLQLPKPEHFAPMFPAPAPAPAPEQERQMLDLGGSFSSLLAASGHFGGLLESFHPTGTGIFSLPNSGDHVGGTMAGSGIDLAGSENRGGNGENPHPEPEQGAAAENFMGLQGDSGCWNGSNGNRDGGGGGSGWPGLSMYTPGSTFRQ